MTSYKRPTANQVQEALRRTPTPQLRRAFYEGLKNPLWLEPLKDQGVFRTPPPRVKMDDGSSADPYWPEMSYLVRVAGVVPKVAVDILVTMSDSDNAWVRCSLFSVGAVVPASEGARLKPVMQAWLESGFGWRTDPREMVDFVTNLFNGGERKVGKWLANAIFRPSLRDDSDKPDLAMEDYWYEAGLPRVVEAMGPDGFNQVLGWLIEYEKASGRMEGWLVSRPSIRERANTHATVEDALIDATRDLAICRMATDPHHTVELLLKVGLMLVRRIAMHSLTEGLSSAEVGTTKSSELIRIATGLLFDPTSNDERCRLEFSELARAVSCHNLSALDPLAAFIADGSRRQSDGFRGRLRRDEDRSEVDIDEEVVEFTERWEHLWLASVGASALPAPQAQRLAELDERLGVIEDPLRPKMMVTSWAGPSSPLTQDEMAAMSPDELVSHLETWHQHGSGWGPGPSHEGQARALTALISTSPQAIAGVKGLMKRLRPIYVRAIFSGWAAASKASLDLDWYQVADATNGALEHRDTLDLPWEAGAMDDESDFISARQAAVSLLDDLVKMVDPQRAPVAVLTRFANQLIELAPAGVEWTEYEAADQKRDVDPLTLSLSLQWPIYLRGLAALVGHGPNSPWSDRARKALLKELERPDPRGASSAVVGENLGRFVNADESWTARYIGDWFGGVGGIDHGQQVALSTAIAVHNYHSRLYVLLAPALLAALSLEGPMVAGWHNHSSTPVQRIGEWCVKALVFGDTDWGDPLVTRFFSTVDARDRGAALGRVAWEFMHASSVDSEIRDRFASIWDARFVHVESNAADSVELAEFHWVVHSGKFDAEWWLPRLKRALELEPALRADRYLIGKDLAAAAKTDPRAAFDATKVLVDKDSIQAVGWIEKWGNSLPIVIALAIGADDEALKADAIAFMNKLGEAGYIDLARLVEAAKDGAITGSDFSG